jgi:predicted ATPase
MVVRLADEHGLSLWRALGIIYTGWSRAENGAPDEAIAMIRDGIAQYRAVGASLSLPLYLASLADLERAAGNTREALKLLGEAQAVATAGDEHWVSAEIHRLTGEAILAGTGDVAGAARECRAALALAKRQGARLWECRAKTSLERLSRSEGAIPKRSGRRDRPSGDTRLMSPAMQRLSPYFARWGLHR